ncbi:MAG: hypothetical protein ACI9LX_001626 [Paraglaciecola sp.]|jgi:hypothetical protein
MITDLPLHLNQSYNDCADAHIILIGQVLDIQSH